MNAIFGLDFGTTNSALAVNEEGAVRIIDADPFNTTGKTLRSILFFDNERNVYSGQEAINHYVKNDEGGRLVQSMKSFLTDTNFNMTVINKRPYKIDDLVAILLRTLKKRGESELGYEVSSVVLGRPAVFSEDPEVDALAEKRLRSAATKAGFENVFFQFEPVAAALTFEASLKPGEEKIILVGDFGGGTSDFTVIRLKGGNFNVGSREKDILSLGGVYIGGDTFNSRIMWNRITPYFGLNAKVKGMRGQWLDIPKHPFLTLCKWHHISLLRGKEEREFISQLRANSNDPEALMRMEELVDLNYGFGLFQSIEKAKCELSSTPTSRIVFHQYLTNIDIDVTQGEFEEMVLDDLTKIDQCVKETVVNSGLATSDIDVVFLTGGSSHVPCIRNIFETMFGNSKIRSADPFTSVVYGLGLSASHLR